MLCITVYDANGHQLVRGESAGLIEQTMRHLPCACMYVCIVCMYICSYEYMYMCMHVCTVRTIMYNVYIQVSLCTYICM